MDFGELDSCFKYKIKRKKMQEVLDRGGRGVVELGCRRASVGGMLQHFICGASARSTKRNIRV